ncbi:MAG: glycerophosphodiester phosphodiesterase [Christensenellales bacterium]
MTFIEKIYSKRRRRLLVGGHRGHLCDVRENTIANFERLRESGIDYIEIDIQLSQDNKLMVYHDIKLDDCSPLTGYIKDYCAEELKAAFEINTLDEVMVWCKENGMPILLEIKNCELLMYDTRPMLTQRIVEALRRRDMFENCIILGIDHCTLKCIKIMEPRVHLALIVPHIPHDPIALMQEMEAEIYLCFQTNLSKPLVQKLQQAGYIVGGSVVNSREQLQIALSLGVNMIETDYPFKILTAYDEIMGV